MQEFIFKGEENWIYLIKPFFLKLKVYDILGKEIAELVNGVKEKEIHNIEFKVENMPSGVYINTIQTKDFIESKRMILMK